MNEQIAKIKKKLKKKLSKERYAHTLGVAYTSMALAMRYGEDIEKAELAGLLHDCGKCMGVSDQMEKCMKFKIALTQDDCDCLAVIHAPLGAYIAEHKYGITDVDILNAIRFHTLGRSKMSRLERIVYIADYIEPRRTQIPDLEYIRKVAFQSLNECVYLIAKKSVEYLESRGMLVHSGSIETYNYYKKQYKEKQDDELE